MSERKKKITRDEVRDEVALILQMAVGNDHEAAHSAEDRLYERVLHTIATAEPGDSLPQAAEILRQVRALARAALKTKGIRFERWAG